MGRDIQDDNENAVVKVTSDIDRHTGKKTTDFIVADKKAKEHHHIVISEDGDTIEEHTKPD